MRYNKHSVSTIVSQSDMNISYELRTVFGTSRTRRGVPSLSYKYHQIKQSLARVEATGNLKW